MGGGFLSQVETTNFLNFGEKISRSHSFASSSNLGHVNLPLRKQQSVGMSISTKSETGVDNLSQEVDPISGMFNFLSQNPMMKQMNSQIFKQ